MVAWRNLIGPPSSLISGPSQEPAGDVSYPDNVRAALWAVIGLLAGSFGTIVALVNSRISDTREDIRAVKGDLASTKDDLVTQISGVRGDLADQFDRARNELQIRISESRETLKDVMEANAHALRSELLAEMKSVVERLDRIDRRLPDRPAGG
jgi:hypothetical protein